MAISTHTVSIAGTWTRVNLMEQLGEGLEWLGWHSIAGSGWWPESVQVEDYPGLAGSPAAA